jgi:hypothetical protein
MTRTAVHDRLDIDIRFLVANDRTLLAWLRAALRYRFRGARRWRTMFTPVVRHMPVKSAPPQLPTPTPTPTSMPVCG